MWLVTHRMAEQTHTGHLLITATVKHTLNGFLCPKKIHAQTSPVYRNISKHQCAKTKVMLRASALPGILLQCNKNFFFPSQGNTNLTRSNFAWFSQELYHLSIIVDVRLHHGNTKDPFIMIYAKKQLLTSKHLP